MSLLLVEDDRGDAAVLVEELISEAVADIDAAWAQSMARAERVLVSARPDCVPLDLNLPTPAESMPSTASPSTTRPSRSSC